MASHVFPPCRLRTSVPGTSAPPLRQQMASSTQTLVNPATGTPFSNNIIPTSSLDPYGLKLMNVFPLPNLPGELNNYARTRLLQR